MQPIMTGGMVVRVPANLFGDVEFFLNDDVDQATAEEVSLACCSHPRVTC